MTLLFVISSSLSGCIGESEESNSIELNVAYSSLQGIVSMSYVDGQLIASEPVEFRFDFSETKSKNKLTQYGLSSPTLSNDISINADENNIISFEIYDHGIHTIEFYAIDSEDFTQTNSIDLKVELEILWVEENSSNPKPLNIDPKPSNEGQSPKYVKVESTVENPRRITEIGGGQSVQFTWKLIDELDDTCQSNSAVVDDGDSLTWDTIYFNTVLIHDLVVQYDDGQDRINIEHKVNIFYED